VSIFYAHPELLIAEALSLSVARRYMNMWPTGEVAAYRDTVFAALEKLPSATRSRNKYRVYVPFALDQTEQQIRDAMKAAGYTIRNYATGDAIEDKTGRVMTMGKVLSTRMKRDDLATLYSRDQMRRDYGNQPSNTLLVFSYHPYDIAGMSTGRSWTSCMTIATEKSEGGSNSQYVSSDTVGRSKHSTPDGTDAHQTVHQYRQSIRDPVSSRRKSLRPIQCCGGSAYYGQYGY
jgi:hypothetical protein